MIGHATKPITFPEPSLPLFSEQGNLETGTNSPVSGKIVLTERLLRLKGVGRQLAKIFSSACCLRIISKAARYVY